jgi:calcineurin-like phosphoesterase family protein
LSKKVVSRKVAFGIGVAIIALLIILSGIVASYVSSLSTISSLQKQLVSDNSEINSLNTTITNLNATITSLQNQVPWLKDTVALERGIDGFTIVQITDTQYLSDANLNLFNGLTNWIATNSQALNLTMVIHTGDIVQVANSNRNWKNANNAMMQLYNNNVPYTWNAGNHDQLNNSLVGGGSPNGSWLGGNYSAFNVTAMRQKPYWAGDISSGKDTAVKFTYDNYHFMIINIEYNANQTVLDWMQTLLKSNPNANVIVATHDFLNGDGGYGNRVNPVDVRWATNFENLLNNYPNVFMTVNGHSVGNGGSAYHKRVGRREEIYFNMQENDSKTGAATARIYTFNMTDTTQPVVNAYTYETFGTPQYLTDQKDQFSFTTDITAYSPSTVSIAANTNFWGANDKSVSFTNTATMSGFSQNGTELTFKNLTLNGVSSNFTVTTLNANIQISNYNPDSSISYTVSGMGSQTFTVNKPAASVYIDGKKTLNGSGWSYSNGEITVTGATSSVVMNFS